MQENQNALQNVGMHGYSNYMSVGNQTSTFIVLIMAFILLIALLKSEERYRKLLENKYLALNDRG
jgi:hypothetical protein